MVVTVVIRQCLTMINLRVFFAVYTETHAVIKGGFSGSKLPLFLLFCHCCSELLMIEIMI